MAAIEDQQRHSAPYVWFFMRDNISTLRSLLERMARIELPGREANRITKQEATELAFSLRDCRLEILRLEADKFSEAQLYRLQQMDYRLQAVVEGTGSAAAISTEAKRALTAFGWGEGE